MKRWLVFLGLADEAGAEKQPLMGIVGTLLIAMAPVAAFAGKLSMSSLLVGAASFVCGAVILLFARSLKRS